MLPSGNEPPFGSHDISGVLYLDSKFASKDISKVGQDILDAMANEAASLVENARLVQAEETARLEQQELAIAATIQQQLMTMTIPEIPYVSINARNICCKSFRKRWPNSVGRMIL